MSKNRPRTQRGFAANREAGPDAVAISIDALLSEFRGTYAAGKVRRQQYLKLMEAVDPVVAAQCRSLNDEYDACMDLILATRH